MSRGFTPGVLAQGITPLNGNGPPVLPGPFDPLFLEPDFWYDFADPATVTLNAGKVSYVADKSGNGNDIYQPTSGHQAPYIEDDSTMNDHNVWAPNGTNLNHRLHWVAAFENVQPFVFYVVFRNVANPINNMIDNQNERILVASQGSSGHFIYAGTSLTSGTKDLETHLITGVFNDTSSILRVDGVEVATGDAGTHRFNALATNTFIGGDGETGSGMNIRLGECFLHGGSEVSTVYEHLLMNKWGIIS